MTTPTLQVTGLSAGYGKLTVLRDANVTVEPGSVVALLGPNGAGKSTLLAAIGGLLTPTSGSVRLGETDITKHRPATRAAAGICLIPEGRESFRDCLCGRTSSLRWTDLSATSTRWHWKPFPRSAGVWTRRQEACPEASSRWSPWHAPSCPAVP